MENHCYLRKLACTSLHALQSMCFNQWEDGCCKPGHPAGLWHKGELPCIVTECCMHAKLLTWVELLLLLLLLLPMSPEEG